MVFLVDRVEVRSQYYPEQSNPLKDQYIFVYKVKITNQSPQTVQLVSRTWEIKAIEATEVCMHCTTLLSMMMDIYASQCGWNMRWLRFMINVLCRWSRNTACYVFWYIFSQLFCSTDQQQRR